MAEAARAERAPAQTVPADRWNPSAGRQGTPVIVHVVLFRPRADLTGEDLEAFGRAIAGARETIPSIRRFQIGRRVRHGRGYEAAMAEDFPFAALIEFDDLTGLRAYLAHPVHQELGRLWAEKNAATLVYDYETRDARDVTAVLEGK